MLSRQFWSVCRMFGCVEPSCYHIWCFIPANICALLDACALPVDAISRDCTTCVILVLLRFARFTRQPSYISGLNGMAFRAGVPEEGSHLEQDCKYCSCLLKFLLVFRLVFGGGIGCEEVGQVTRQGNRTFKEQFLNSLKLTLKFEKLLPLEAWLLGRIFMYNLLMEWEGPLVIYLANFLCDYIKLINKKVIYTKLIQIMPSIFPWRSTSKDLCTCCLWASCHANIHNQTSWQGCNGWVPC